MKAAGALLPTLLLPLVLAAQDVPPPGLAEVELARSRNCVAALARVAELNETLEPYTLRLDRLNALGRAVSLESRQEAAPFDPADPLEEAVARWFAADSALAARYLEQPDSALLEERGRARDAILERIVQAMDEVSAQARERAGDTTVLDAEAQMCEGAVLVRSAVLEACAAAPGPLCQAAAGTAALGPYRFVEAAEDVWDLEEYRPWTQPTPLQASPEGALVGARTAARARRGNVVVTLSLTPLIQSRSELEEEDIARFQANLDSLGYTFDHPLFVMAPGLEIQASLPAPLGGETHYVLHFGDLSAEDVIWSMEVGPGGLAQALFPAPGPVLSRLREGEEVSLTALRIRPEEDEPAEAVFTISLLQVGQVSAVDLLLHYMAEGGLARDLAAIIPPGLSG